MKKDKIIENLIDFPTSTAYRRKMCKYMSYGMAFLFIMIAFGINECDKLDDSKGEA